MHMKVRKLYWIIALLFVIASAAYYYFDNNVNVKHVFEGTLVDSKDNLRKSSGELKRACRRTEQKIERGIDKVSGYAEKKINKLQA